jgi:hypothetical protein
VTEFHIGYADPEADRFNVYVCIGFFRGIEGLNPDMRMEFPLFGF